MEFVTLSSGIKMPILGGSGFSSTIGTIVELEPNATVDEEGFAFGADDYIKKPFSLSELRARVAAHLRRERREDHTVG